MSQSGKVQLIRILAQTDLTRSIMGFLVDREARGLSRATIEYYGEELRHLQSYLERRGVQNVQDVTADSLRRYLLDLAQHRNPGGVHAAYRAMRAFLRWYETEYEPANWSNPIIKVAAPRVPMQALEPVSLSDLRAMLATCERRTFRGDRDRALLLALLDTGCRASEFCALNLQDLNMSSGEIIVRRGKAGKPRAVFVGARCRRELMRYVAHLGSTSGPLWVSAAGKRLGYDSLRGIVARRGMAAGAPVPALHSFRRGFALAMLKSGADVVSISRLLGHANLGLLMRYIRQRADDLAEVHRNAGPVDKLLTLGLCAFRVLWKVLTERGRS